MATGKTYIGYSAYGFGPPKEQVVVTRETLGSGIDVSSQRSLSVTKSISKSGYTPVGIVGQQFAGGSGGSYVSYGKIELSGSSIVSVIVNATSGNTSGITAYAYVLWVKNL